MHVYCTYFYYSHSVMPRGNSYALHLRLRLVSPPAMDQSWTNRSSAVSPWTNERKRPATANLTS